MIKEALHAWSQGHVADAKKQFLQLYTELAHLPTEHCKALGQFFDAQHMHPYAIACYARFLEVQFDASVAERYVTLIEGDVNERQRLLVLFDFYEERCHPALLLQMIERLKQLGEPALAYQYAIHVLATFEQQAARVQQLTASHVDVALFIIEVDVQNGYYTQARFQLRKLLTMNESLVQYEPLICWALKLELAELVIARPDYRTIRENVDAAVKHMLLFYEHFMQKKLYPHIALLQEQPIADAWLAHKAQALIQMTNWLSQKGINETIVKSLYDVYPYDYTIAQLYGLIAPKETSFQQKWFEYFCDLEKGVAYYRQPPKQRTSSVQITMLGGGEKIGGTAVLVELHNRCILLDAGMFLNSEQLITNIELIAERGYRLDELDGIFISHAHLDHTGSLPYIHALAPNVPIYMTKETKKLMHLLLRSVVVNQPNCPYNEQHVNALIAHTATVAMNEPLTVGPWRITFYEAGHITGAASIYVEAYGQTVLFTGDFSLQKQATCGQWHVPHTNIDVLITESTYGYVPLASRLPSEQQHQLFLNEVLRTTKRGGCCIVPAFAVGRAQEVLSVLQQAYDGFFPFDVIVDGAVEQVCDIYEGTRYFELAERVVRGNAAHARTLCEETKGAVVIASSGMLNEGSASSKYAYAHIDDPASTIIFTGYLDAMSPAYDLYRRCAKSFKIAREPYKEVRAHLTSFALSAHVHRDDLFQAIYALKPKHVVLMHGEHEQRYTPYAKGQQGAVIYPSIVEMLQWANIQATCAVNTKTYTI